MARSRPTGQTSIQPVPQRGRSLRREWSFKVTDISGGHALRAIMDKCVKFSEKPFRRYKGRHHKQMLARETEDVLPEPKVPLGPNSLRRSCSYNSVASFDEPLPSDWSTSSQLNDTVLSGSRFSFKSTKTRISINNDVSPTISVNRGKTHRAVHCMPTGNSTFGFSDGEHASHSNVSGSRLTGVNGPSNTIELAGPRSTPSSSYRSRTPSPESHRSRTPHRTSYRSNAPNYRSPVNKQRPHGNMWARLIARGRFAAGSPDSSFTKKSSWKSSTASTRSISPGTSTDASPVKSNCSRSSSPFSRLGDRLRSALSFPTSPPSSIYSRGSSNGGSSCRQIAFQTLDNLSDTTLDSLQIHRERVLARAAMNAIEISPTALHLLAQMEAWTNGDEDRVLTRADMKVISKMTAEDSMAVQVADDIWTDMTDSTGYIDQGNSDDATGEVSAEGFAEQSVLLDADYELIRQDAITRERELASGRTREWVGLTNEDLFGGNDDEADLEFRMSDKNKYDH